MVQDNGNSELKKELVGKMRQPFLLYEDVLELIDLGLTEDDYLTLFVRETIKTNQCYNRILYLVDRHKWYRILLDVQIKKVRNRSGIRYLVNNLNDVLGRLNPTEEYRLKPYYDEFMLVVFNHLTNEINQTRTERKLYNTYAMSYLHIEDSIHYVGLVGGGKVSQRLIDSIIQLFKSIDSGPNAMDYQKHQERFDQYKTQLLFELKDEQLKVQLGEYFMSTVSR